MFGKILVPLDGSPLAETVLPQVAAIASEAKVDTIVFIRVIEPVYPPSGEAALTLFFTDDNLKKMREAQEADAEDYLKSVVDRLAFAGVTLETKVIHGKAADSIADFAEHNRVSLIVVATHGRSGAGRWVMGSVANRILHSSCVPVLMVRAECMVAEDQSGN